jgi:membrane-anchored protein YejM (alkaline phosphatase superfamily)
MIASRYLFHPVQAATAVGISFVTPLGMTIARVGFGAFPLACSLFTLSCLLSSRRLLTGLGFVATVMGAVLVVRVFGMLADGTIEENMHLVIAEVVFLVLMLVGMTIERGRRQQLEQPAA